MSPIFDGRPRHRYHIVLLSIWEEGVSYPGGHTMWRFSLEHPGTMERKGFSSVHELADYLDDWMHGPGQDSPAQKL
jgi:hypothetical protein